MIPKYTKTYHTVCPVYTYNQDDWCYSQPVNRAVLTVLPLWTSSSNKLAWQFSILNSSLIDQNTLYALRTDWKSNDAVIQNAFDTDNFEYTHEVSSDLFRQESEYQITASLANVENTFYEMSEIKFIPSQCHWFTFQNTNSA